MVLLGSLACHANLLVTSSGNGWIWHPFYPVMGGYPTGSKIGCLSKFESTFASAALKYRRYPPTYLAIIPLGIMEIATIYAITASGIFGCLLVIQLATRLANVIQPLHILFLRHLFYPFFLNRYQLFGPWTRIQVVIQAIYLTAVCFCSGYQTSGWQEVGTRAGMLALINLLPAYFGPHLSFVGDIFGLSLSTYHLIHTTTAVVSTMLGFLHVVINVAHRTSVISAQIFGQLVRYPSLRCTLEANV